MRRARIKALASVPIRKNPAQDIVASDISSVSDKEQNKEGAAAAESKSEQEAIKDIAEAKNEREEGISNTVILKQDPDVVTDVAKASEEIIEKEQKEASFVEPEPVIVHKRSDFQEPYSQVKPSSQELCVQVKPDSQQLCVQAKSDSQKLCDQINDKPEKFTDHLVQKSISPPPDLPLTGIETSPAKNRLCFMRPVPRLDTGGRVRKNSIQGSGASASESEDEHGKRATTVVVPSRIRNDSICSVQSNKESIAADNQNTSSRMKAMQRRRMQVSESARRLAEARREFLLKHENRTPDKSQMKMYDFIYYNPVTNPMKPNKSPQRIAAQPMEIPEEEEEDNPSVMPVPQVKVGPDGQLIIDEQSLVIEQKDAKRVREIMSSDIIIEEGICNNGGFYKKHKRSKDWPKWETLKFYRVLNVVGTDFLLMQTLFPNRTREEIKQKYKKEERVNRSLIEKALKYHQEFDTEMLEEQLGLVANSIGECEALSVNNEEVEDTTILTSDEIDVEINNEANTTPQQIRKGSKARKLKRRLDDTSDNSDVESASCSDSDSSPEIYRVRPTRSGRQPKKAKKLQAPDINMLNISNTISDNDVNESSVIDDSGETVMPSHVAVEVTEVVNTPTEDGKSVGTSYPENIANVIPNINQMEPGSLVIVTKESAEEPGNTILQVYMVSPNVDNVANAAIELNESTTDPQKPSEFLTNKPETAKSVDIVNICEK
ncbi:transcription factor TFIIIB component B'' homolog isoform X2 [Nylanderia fulva]|uniref:transcription factor TFIIIB component B'' homolog isoform X2 n=1 Tax=Nylanderia fulva TaxID=613905 RepID=UPI0010FBBAC5|nr:transcription factor TFIIIB component B'' homolog isoform X2 [Nylanderia fulva]